MLDSKDVKTIGYVCKYTPIEVLAGFGDDTSFLLPEMASYDYADSRVWPSLCGYAKSVLERLRGAGYDAVVFTDCCDAMKRVRDVLAADAASNVPDVKPFILGLPRVTTDEAARSYSRNIVDFISGYERYSGRVFDAAAFLRACSDANDDSVRGGEGYVAVMGARAPRALMKSIGRFSSLPVRDLTCGSRERHFTDMPNIAGTYSDLYELMYRYARRLLSQAPCMRMNDIGARRSFTDDTRLKAVVYHTIQFCDFYGFEYAQMPREIPVLKVDTDFTAASSGQLVTRLQAFFESNGILDSGARNELSIRFEGKRGDKVMRHKYYAGIDSGSTSTNVVIINRDANIVAAVSVPSGANSADAARAALADALAEAGRTAGLCMTMEDMAAVVATGYGRASVPFTAENVTEITCHARGAHSLVPEARTVIDIGGQDSKVIRMKPNGGVMEFSMNDKCAAGTGRFLELMADTLELGIDEMAGTGLHPHKVVGISSMCAVFAESEVISLIAKGLRVEDIVWGVDLAIAGRVAGMAYRLGAEPPYIMTGGVAQNAGVVKALGEKLGERGGQSVGVIVPDVPQLCGALGAALIAREL
ncbi:MAG: acyl-CoA dehydratase activase [Clostridiales Family XIII bacterium]|nr:acyl-CoA dehydratase activase [Clostridiales Family XIII bacterium]